MIDLESIAMVHHVVVYNRRDYCREKLNNFKLFALEHELNTVSEKDYSGNSPVYVVFDLELR